MKKYINSWLTIIKQNKSAVFTAFLLMVFGDIFFWQVQSDILIFGILGLYILIIKSFKLESKITFSFCFFILGFLFIGFVFTGTSINTEKAAVFLFFFMAIGILQKLLKINETS